MAVMKLFLAALAVTIATASVLSPRQSSGQQFVPRPGYFPPTGDDTIAGGIFCISLPDLATYLAKTGNNPAATGTESPKRNGVTTSGSGPYPAPKFTDPSLPQHTIYAPKSPPPTNVTLPVIAWGNGGCGTDPTSYEHLLVEIASHGYVIAADGVAGGTGASQSMLTDMEASVNWLVGGKAAKYGAVDAVALTTMGHSCGGLEAMSKAYHDDRAKRIVMLDIGIFQDEKRYLLQEIKVPVAWFVGGPKDMGYPNVEKDYKLLNGGLPAYKANLDTGHGGTFAATNGGKQGKAVVNYLEWQWRNDTAAKAKLLDPKAPGSIVSDGYSVEFKNWA